LLKHHNGTLNNGTGPITNVTRTPTPNAGSWSGLVGGYGAAALSKINLYANIYFYFVTNKFKMFVL
jgi:hypothetical protein